MPSTTAILESQPRPEVHCASWHADRFGIDVSLDGDLLVVGHERDTRLGVNRAGSASTFARRSGHWTEEAIVMDVTPSTWETFGGSVAVGGSIVAVGNPLSHVSGVQGPGTALVFNCAENPRIQPPTLRIDGRKRLSLPSPIVGHPHASPAPAPEPLRRDR